MHSHSGGGECKGREKGERHIFSCFLAHSCEPRPKIYFRVRQENRLSRKQPLLILTGAVERRTMRTLLNLFWSVPKKDSGFPSLQHVLGKIMNESKSTERWVPLAPEFPTYEVSSTGLVRTTGHNSRILATRFLSSGGAPAVFLRVRDADGGVRRLPRSVSMLVAKAFVPNPHGATTLRFLDGDRRNAAAGNLAWVVKDTKMREYEKRTMGEETQRIIQQETFDRLSAVEQREYLCNEYLPAGGVILKPLDPRPDPLPVHEMMLIKWRHVIYPDLPQPDSITYPHDNTASVQGAELRALLSEINPQQDS